VYEVMWKNIVDPDRLQMTIWCMRITCWMLKATDALKTRNTLCFSAGTMVTRTCLIATFYVHCLC